MNTASEFRNHRVALLLDEAYDSEQLLAMAQRVHVWAVASDFNRKTARVFWEKVGKDGDEYGVRVTWSPEFGITLFERACGEEDVNALLRILEEIELHHDDPPVTQLEVHGLSLDKKRIAALGKMGLRFLGEECGGYVFELV
jgi:hypothetical protein